MAWSLLGRGLVRPCGWWPLNWGQWCHRFPLAHQDLLLQSGRFSQRHSYFSISPLTPSKLWSLVIFGWISLKYVTDICTLFHFLGALAALYLHRWRTDWLKNHHSERSTRQCAHVWSDNLQLPYTSKLEVIWDQTTSDLLVYSLQFPHTTSNLKVNLSHFNLKLPYKYDQRDFSSMSFGEKFDNYLRRKMPHLRQTGRTGKTCSTFWLSRTLVWGRFRNSCEVFFFMMLNIICLVAFFL